MTQYLQICNDLGKNVPSKAPFLLTEQLSTASVEQFCIKFMTKTTKVNPWVHQVHGKTHDTILSMSSEPDYVSVEGIIEAACEEYTILLSANHWGCSGKPDPGNAPEGLFTKADINTLIQKQISAALNNKPDHSKPKSTNLNVCCNYCKEHGHVKSDCPKLAVKKACDATKPSSTNSHSGSQSHSACTPAVPWKAIAPAPGKPETKTVENKTWHWCAKCGFWHLSHGTSTHSEDFNFTKTACATLTSSTNQQDSFKAGQIPCFPSHHEFVAVW